MDGLKQSKQAVAGDVLTSMSGFAPPILLALGGRLAAPSPTLGVQTGVTNVPGPQHPLRTLDRTLLESFPFVPLIGQVRISIAIFSYDGGRYFGVTGDYDSSNDIDILTAGVERSIVELLERVAGPSPTEALQLPPVELPRSWVRRRLTGRLQGRPRLREKNHVGSDSSRCPDSRVCAPGHLLCVPGDGHDGCCRAVLDGSDGRR